jgi:peptidoglycan/LPS O-acetylase OafA/YrhL
LLKGSSVLRNSLSSPLFAVLLYGAALLTSLALVRLVPAIRGNIESAKRTRNESIDGLRGFLALGVFVHHCVVTWYYKEDGVWQVPPSNFYTELGEASVALFFMITAFLFWGRLLEEGSRIDWRHLYLSRIFRLYPVYIFMLLLVVVSVFSLSGWTLHEGRMALLQQLLRWLMFTILGAPNINHVANTAMLTAYVTWTLRYEWLFYLALPLLGLLFANSGKSVAAILTGIPTLLLFWLYHRYSAIDIHILLAFSGGIVAAYWVRSERLRGLAQSPFATLCAIVALLMCLFVYRTAYSTGPLILLGILFVVVASGSTLFGVLRWRAVKWLGEISYSTYLLHGFLVWLILQRMVRDHQGWFYLLASMATTVSLVLLNTVSFLWIEKPGMALGKSIEQRWRGLSIGRLRSTILAARRVTAP